VTTGSDEVVSADSCSDPYQPFPGFKSLLSEDLTVTPPAGPEQSPFASDLNIDQIISSVVAGQDDAEFISSLLYHQIHDLDTLRYRYEVFRDLESPDLMTAVKTFGERMRQVRLHLIQLKKMDYRYQREGWFLDAAAIYCEAVGSFAAQLESLDVASRGLRGFRTFLLAYVNSASFGELNVETIARKRDLANIEYSMRIRGGKVEVSRYEDEADYTVEVEGTFERFSRAAGQSYLVNYRGWPGMNHIAAQILGLVARLFEPQFTALDNFCHAHANFLDPTIDRFEREVQFYIAFLDHLQPLRSRGLKFCYPELSPDSKEIFAKDTFDLALAERLNTRGDRVVCNNFHLSGVERVIVVSGPNQGGKTTFARTFGQLHHFANVGCPVPGSAARLFVFDHLLTHFEREEDLANLRGKLEDDLVRVQQMLGTATTNSIIIMNEVFTSTTLADARFLGRKVMERIIDLDLLCVYVTFVMELSNLGDSVVSMVSTIAPDDPAERTYKVVRRPADGLAYALALAEKYGLTFEQLKKRLAQ
jgi:DNA mismatch repair protein MutS